MQYLYPNEEDSKRLETLDGRRPWAVRQIDPSKRYAVLDVRVDHEPRAAIWEIATGKLMWAPTGAQVICWSQDGSEVFAAGEIEAYHRGFLRRYTWPARALTNDGIVEMGGYLFESMATAPTGLLALCSIGQGETYVGLHDVSDARNWPVSIARWEDRGANQINGLEFYPDGSALVWTLGGAFLHDYWWTRKDDPEPSEGGRFDIGRIFVWGINGRIPRDLRMTHVVADLPVEWLPEDPKDTLCSEMFLGPIFDDKGNFRVLLPTGEWRTYTSELKEMPNREVGKRAVVKDFATIDLRKASQTR